MSEEPYVLRSVNEGVVTLTLNRGERYNSLSLAMITALATELDRLAADETARVVVLAGAGRGFCAGHDLKEMRAHVGDGDWQRELFVRCGRMMVQLTRLPQPVIARVHGIATAAGCQLVSMCDLVVAASEAKFALPGIGVGVFCSTPAVGVVRSVGQKRTMEMLLTGEPIDAARALEWGLVNRVVPSAELDDAIARMARSIGSRSWPVVSTGKRAFYDQVGCELDEAYRRAAEAMTADMTFEDAAEGIDAFIEKRKPVWRDR